MRAPEGADRSNGNALGTWCVVVAVTAFIATVPETGLALVRSCGPDAVANTNNVLCAAPSGPCTGASVTMSSAISVTAGG
jgi:hypothetical protein